MDYPNSRRAIAYLVSELTCKPGPVVDSHLSRRTVAGTFKPPPESGRADLRTEAPLSHGVAPDRVYSDGRFHAVGRALTSAFPPLPAVNPAVYLCCTFPEVAFGGRYPLSFALWSPDFPHAQPFGLCPRLSGQLALLFYAKMPHVSNKISYLPLCRCFTANARYG